MHTTWKKERLYEHTHTRVHTHTVSQYLRQLFPYGTHIQRTMGNYALFYGFFFFFFWSALFCYSREQKKIQHHVRDHAQWFGLHLPWETQLSKQALSIIVHKTWQIVLDRQTCPSFRSVTLSKPTAQVISNKQAQFLKIKKCMICQFVYLHSLLFNIYLLRLSQL